MSITPHPTEDGIWIIRFYEHGRKNDPKTSKPSNKGRKRLYFEGTKVEAELYYQELLRAKTPNTRMAAPTLAEAYPDYLAYCLNNMQPSTVTSFVMCWKSHIEPFFGKFRPNHLTGTIIEQYKTWRSSHTTSRGTLVKPRTITKELVYLSGLISWMSKPENNFCEPLSFRIRGFPAKQTKAPLPVVFDRVEVVRFLRKLKRRYRGIFVVMYYGGLRKTESFTLSKDRINLQAGYMVVRGKGNKERIVPIHGKARVYLRKRLERSTVDYLWVSPRTKKPYTDLGATIRETALRAGITKRAYAHVMRHNFGTHSIMGGAGLRSVQMMMGHSSSQTTEIYSTLAATFLNAEMQKLGRGAPRR